MRCTVVSTVKTQPPMVADELRRQADRFIDLNDIADQIQREGNREPREPRDNQRDYRDSQRDYSPRDYAPPRGPADEYV